MIESVGRRWLFDVNQQTNRSKSKAHWVVQLPRDARLPSRRKAPPRAGFPNGLSAFSGIAVNASDRERRLGYVFQNLRPSATTKSNWSGIHAAVGRVDISPVPSSESRKVRLSKDSSGATGFVVDRSKEHTPPSISEASNKTASEGSHNGLNGLCQRGWQPCRTLSPAATRNSHRPEQIPIQEAANASSGGNVLRPEARMK